MIDEDFLYQIAKYCPIQQWEGLIYNALIRGPKQTFWDHVEYL